MCRGRGLRDYGNKFRKIRDFTYLGGGDDEDSAKSEIFLTFIVVTMKNLKKSRKTRFREKISKRMTERSDSDQDEKRSPFQRVGRGFTTYNSPIGLLCS